MHVNACIGTKKMSQSSQWVNKREQYLAVSHKNAQLNNNTSAFTHRWAISWDFHMLKTKYKRCHLTLWVCHMTEVILFPTHHGQICYPDKTRIELTLTGVWMQQNYMQPHSKTLLTVKEEWKKWHTQPDEFQWSNKPLWRHHVSVLCGSNSKAIRKMLLIWLEISVVAPN